MTHFSFFVQTLLAFLTESIKPYKRVEVTEWKETNWQKNYAARMYLRDWSFKLIPENLENRGNYNRNTERRKRSKFKKVEVCNDKKLLVKRFHLCIESKINLIKVNWFYMKEKKTLHLDLNFLWMSVYFNAEKLWEVSWVKQAQTEGNCYARNPPSPCPQPPVLPGTVAAILSAISSPQEKNFGFATENILS